MSRFTWFCSSSANVCVRVCVCVHVCVHVCVSVCVHQDQDQRPLSRLTNLAILITDIQDMNPVFTNLPYSTNIAEDKPPVSTPTPPPPPPPPPVSFWFFIPSLLVLRCLISTSAPFLIIRIHLGLFSTPLLSKATYNKYICQRKEKQYISVGTVR